MKEKCGALVVGALYEGLTLAAAIRLAADGHPIGIVHRISTSRPPDVVDKLAAEITAFFKVQGWPVRVYRIDTSSFDEMQELCELANRELGDIGIVLCGEGTKAYNLVTSDDFNGLDWWQSMQEEVLPLITLVKGVLPGMRKNKFGRVINIGMHIDSWENHLPLHGGHRIFKNNLGFVSGKSVRSFLTSSIGLTELRVGITVNTIAPGRLINLKLPALIKLQKDGTSTSLEGEATSWDFANLVSFLASESASHISGGVLPLLNSPIQYTLRNSNDH